MFLININDVIYNILHFILRDTKNFVPRGHLFVLLYIITIFFLRYDSFVKLKEDFTIIFSIPYIYTSIFA